MPNQLLKELTNGLLYTHLRLNANATRTLESASFLYALIEILEEKGLISIEELDQRQKEVARRLIQKFVESGIGFLYQDTNEDKYSFKGEAHADCQNRLDTCKAMCCKFPFALSKQDVEEGKIRWEFGRPYLIAHDEDGYCVHLDKSTYHCTVREHRPLPCRGFDCKENEKWAVWLDYNKKILNDRLMEEMAENIEKFYSIPSKEKNG